MIPAAAGCLKQDFEVKEQPGLTWRMEPDGDHIRGEADGREAVRQAVFCMTQIERYEYIMYPWWYGIETKDLFGEPVSYVCPELKRRSTEALLCDDRILGVDQFRFELPQKRVVHVTYTVHTVFGDVPAGREVNF